MLASTERTLYDPQQPVALLKSSRSTKLPAMAQISAIGATIPERTGRWLVRVDRSVYSRYVRMSK